MVKLRHGALRFVLLIAVLIYCWGDAMPTISGITGAVTHGQSITISGTDFGTKTTAAPLVWDDSSGPTGPGGMLDIWTDAWPDAQTDTTLRIQRRTPIRGVIPPHGRVGKYIAASHYMEGASFNGRRGPVIQFWKTFTRPDFPFYVYQSFWMRADPNWTFSTAGDNNFKHCTYGGGSHPYADPQIQIVYPGGEGGPMTIDDTTINWHAYTGQFTTTMLPNGLYGQFNDCEHPMQGWVKYELELKADPEDGFLKIYEHGRLVFDRQHLDLDFEPGLNRMLSFGGYARNYWATQCWRYYTDCYQDVTLQRVILGNAPVFANCTVREVQIPTAWSSTSVSVTVNRGVIGDNDPAYLFVVDANGVASDGFLVDENPQPAPPVITSPLSVSATVGDTANYQIVASNNPTSYSASPLPAGTSFDATLGRITGTYQEAGFTETTISASNADGADQEVVRFNVEQPVAVGFGTPVNIGKASNNTGPSIQIATTVNVPAGMTVFVALTTRGDSTAANGHPSCSDPLNGIYERDLYRIHDLGTTTKTALFRTSNSEPLAAGTLITINNDFDDAKIATAWYVDGLATINPLDQVNSDVSPTPTTTPDSGPITTTS